MSSDPESPAAPPSDRIYNATFWFAYLANLLLVTANGLTFRFAEFVNFLGGTEDFTGFLVSVGAAAAILCRLSLGGAIDRFGVRRLWILSAFAGFGGIALFMFATDLTAMLWGGRILFAVGLAGVFTCSVVHIQNEVPTHRRTEAIAALGSSGFLGLILGPALGDLIFSLLPEGQTRYLALFGTAVGLGFAHVVFLLLCTRTTEKITPPESPGVLRLLRDYWPGMICLVALLMGTAFATISVFLTRFATHHGLLGVGTFFTGYASCAFVFRVMSRTWSQRFGFKPLVLMGIAAQIAGYAMLPFVESEWHFLVPAMICGFGHALLFPVVVSLGSGTFPRRYRGTGTTLVLGFVDLGGMLAAPVLGGAIILTGDYAAPFWVTVALACVTFVAFLFAPIRVPVDEISTAPTSDEPIAAPVAETPPSGGPRCEPTRSKLQ